jgi:hypothetical protein
VIASILIGELLQVPMNTSEENASLSQDEKKHLLFLAPDMKNYDDSPVSSKKVEKAKWTLDEVQS